MRGTGASGLGWLLQRSIRGQLLFHEQGCAGNGNGGRKDVIRFNVRHAASVEDGPGSSPARWGRTDPHGRLSPTRQAPSPSERRRLNHASIPTASAGSRAPCVIWTCGEPSTTRPGARYRQIVAPAPTAHQEQRFERGRPAIGQQVRSGRCRPRCAWPAGCAEDS